MARSDTTWDRVGFYDAIDEVRALAGELWYIDRAVDYVESEAGYVSPNEVSGPTTTVEVEIGWTAPFRMSIRQPTVLATQGWADGVSQRLQEFANGGASWAQGELAGLSTQVQDIARPDAAVFTDAATALRDQVDDAIGTQVPEDISASYEIAAPHFWGSAAEQFRRNFDVPFGDARENQRFVAVSTGIISAAAAAIIHTAQHSLMNLACSMRDTLRDQITLRQANHSGAIEVATILRIADATTTLLGYFGLPKVAAKAVSISGDLLSYAETGVQDGETQAIAEMTAEGYLGGQHDVVARIVENYWNHWDALQHQRVHVLSRIIEAMPADKPLYVRRPDLADGVPPDDFHFDNSGRYTG